MDGRTHKLAVSKYMYFARKINWSPRFIGFKRTNWACAYETCPNFIGYMYVQSNWVVFFFCWVGMISVQVFFLILLFSSNISRICITSSLISKKPLTECGMQPYGPPCGSTMTVQKSSSQH